MFKSWFTKLQGTWMNGGENAIVFSSEALHRSSRQVYSYELFQIHCFGKAVQKKST